MEQYTRNNTQKNIQVLQINADNFGNGGTSAIISRFMNILEHYGIKHDYLTFRSEYENISHKNSSRLVYIKKSNIPFIKSLKKFLDVLNVLNHTKYDIIHINGDDIIAMFPYLMASRLARSNPQVVLHSHTSHGNYSSNAKNELREICCKILRTLFCINKEVLVSCSSLAAKHAFGKKNVAKTIIIKNGIDYSKYHFNEEARKILRSKYSISDDTVIIGHIGQFSYAKNHSFLLNIFEQYHQLNCKSELWLIGTGGLLEQQIHLQARNIVSKESIRFLGHQDSISDYLSAMDIFVFPSHYEGFPLALTEAQANGLPYLYSNAITKECIFSHKGIALDISAPPKIWADSIAKLVNSHTIRDTINMDESLDINECAKKLLTVYTSCIKK